MAKRGPKPIEIDWNQFDKLCLMQCTATEIAAWFDCSVDTIENKVREEFDMKFSEYFRQKKEKGKIALRRAQYQTAIDKGNTTMQIWLGKQYLGQSEKLTTIDKTPESTGSSDERKARIELIKKMAKEGVK